VKRSESLPPLASLRAFEAAGRLLNFRLAGEELSISQSAVSHHIKLLENFVGVPLFDRAARQVSLTHSGTAFYDAVLAAFDLLRAGVGEVKGWDAASTVRVSLLPSFASNWLVPRLANFTTSHPDIIVELDPSIELANLSSGGA
jgi:LysR family transcriptional regulator, glycine cleavage system transcriptional activator